MREEDRKQGAEEYSNDRLVNETNNQEEAAETPRRTNRTTITSYQKLPVIAKVELWDRSHIIVSEKACI